MRNLVIQRITELRTTYPDLYLLFDELPDDLDELSNKELLFILEEMVIEIQIMLGTE